MKEISLEKIAKTGRKVLDITAFATGCLYSITKYKIQSVYHNLIEKNDRFRTKN